MAEIASVIAGIFIAWYFYFLDNVAKSGMRNGGLANTIAPLEP